MTNTDSLMVFDDGDFYWTMPSLYRRTSKWTPDLTISELKQQFRKRGVKHRHSSAWLVFEGYLEGVEVEETGEFSMYSKSRSIHD